MATAATPSASPPRRSATAASTALVIPMRGPTSSSGASQPGGGGSIAIGPVEQVGVVVVELDVERLGQLARAAAEVLCPLQSAPGAHDLEPLERLQRADQHRGADALVLADRVEQRVDAVGAVDVGARRRAEQDARARRQPDEARGRPAPARGRPRSRRSRPPSRRGAGRSRPGRARPRRRRGRRTRGSPAELGPRALQLLAHARQRGAALGDLRLEPRALGEQLVELVVELGRVARRAPPATARRATCRRRACRARARRRSRATGGTARRAGRAGRRRRWRRSARRRPPRRAARGRS